MDTFGVSSFVQEERNRWTDKINRDAWKIEHIEQPTRGRLKAAMLRRMTGF